MIHKESGDGLIGGVFAFRFRWEQHSKSILGAVIACAITSISSINPVQADGYEIIEIGTLGGFSALASDINNAAEITGYSWTSEDTRHAFIYDGNMLDLCALTECTEQGWDRLYLANGINDHGDISGYGFARCCAVDFFLTTGPYQQARPVLLSQQGLHDVAAHKPCSA